MKEHNQEDDLVLRLQNRKLPYREDFVDRLSNISTSYPQNRWKPRALAASLLVLLGMGVVIATYTKKEDVVDLPQSIVKEDYQSIEPDFDVSFQEEIVFLQAVCLEEFDNFSQIIDWKAWQSPDKNEQKQENLKIDTVKENVYEVYEGVKYFMQNYTDFSHSRDNQRQG